MAVGNGPPHGKGTKQGRARHTLTADPFPLNPQDQTSYGLGIAGLKYDYKTTVAQLKAQADMARQQFKLARTQARQGAVGGLADVDQAMAERGLVGSTAHTLGYEDVKGARDAAIAEALLQKQQAIAGTKFSKLQAAGDFRFGLAQMKANKAAAQALMGLGSFGSGGSDPWGLGSGSVSGPGFTGSVTSGGGGGFSSLDSAGGITFGRKAHNLADRLSGASSGAELRDLINSTRWYRTKAHHDGRAGAGDVNVYRGALQSVGEGSTNDFEQRRLARLFKALYLAYGPGGSGALDELIFDPLGYYFRGGSLANKPYGGHRAHLHFNLL